MATWNCGGLSYTQRELCRDLNYDILALTETHDNNSLPAWSNYLRADSAPATDRSAGVGLLISDQVKRCIMHSGCIGSRIVYARVRGDVCNLFVIGIYVPHSKRSNPSRAETLDELNTLLLSVSQRDCVVILGDFNSRLPRSTEKLTGRWCTHRYEDDGGKMIMNLMRKNRLVAASTLHQPRRRHTNATFIPRDPRYKPKQLDYIICSARWVSSVSS